jgi:hypothetical protein
MAVHMIFPTPTETAIRELDHRTNDGIDVTLFWDARTERVFVAVEDRRTGDWFSQDVRASDALDAFRHPYRYRHSRAGDDAEALAETPS